MKLNVLWTYVIILMEKARVSFGYMFERTYDGFLFDFFFFTTWIMRFMAVQVSNPCLFGRFYRRQTLCYRACLGNHSLFIIPIWCLQFCWLIYWLECKLQIQVVTLLFLKIHPSNFTRYKSSSSGFINTIFPSLPWPSCLSLLPVCLPELYTCPAHRCLPDLITVMMLLDG